MKKLRKAVFLDRDGVINKEKGYYIHTIEEFEVNDGVITFMQKMKAEGWVFIVISNQGGIGKGLYTKADVEKIHHYLSQKLSKHNIEIEEFYYCPHHPQSGNCLCRKPGSLLLEKAIARHGINQGESFMIGDTDRDIMAARQAGLKAFKIPPNENLMEHYQRFTLQ